MLDLHGVGPHLCLFHIKEVNIWSNCTKHNVEGVTKMSNLNTCLGCYTNVTINIIQM